MTPHAPKRAIVMSGGGARGAYEAGVLRYLLTEFPKRTGSTPRFDIVGGTSVGAIHAAFLGATADGGTERGEQLAGIWDGLRVDEVFRTKGSSLFEIPRRMWGLRKVAAQLRQGQRPDRLYGMLDTAPLERLVVKSIPWRGIRRNVRAGNIDAVCIAATQIATGRAVVFTETAAELPPWANHQMIHMQKLRLTPIHAMASAAIPLLFPAVRVGARYYADGGLRLNTPLSPAIRLGANRILVIGLSHENQDDVPESLAQERAAGFGNPLYLLGKVLNALLLSPIETDVARMELVNTILADGEAAFGADFAERLQAATSARGGRELQQIQSLVIRPSENLGMIAGELLRNDTIELSPFLRYFMRAFRSSPDPREADLLSYLLFDSAYARPLADLGYNDAKARHDELEAFFSDDPVD